MTAISIKKRKQQNNFYSLRKLGKVIKSIKAILSQVFLKLNAFMNKLWHRNKLAVE